MRPNFFEKVLDTLMYDFIVEATLEVVKDDYLVVDVGVVQILMIIFSNFQLTFYLPTRSLVKDHC